MKKNAHDMTLHIRNSISKARGTFVFLQLHKNQHGSLLLFIILSILLLAIGAGAIMRMSGSSVHSSVAANRFAAAYYAAQAGIRYAAPQIINDYNTAQADLDGRTYPLSPDTLSFTLEVDTATNPNFVYVTSLGVASPQSGVQSQVSVTSRYTLDSSAQGDRLNIPWLPPYEVFANSNAPNAIKYGWSVSGDARYGTNGGLKKHPHNHAQIDLTENAGLTLDPPPDPPGYPSPTQDPGLGAQGPFALDVTLVEGAYGADTIRLARDDNVLLESGVTLVVDRSLRLTAASVLTINGDATIVAQTLDIIDAGVIDIQSGDVVMIIDDLNMAGGTTINIAEGSTLTIFVRQKAEFLGGVRVNSNGSAEQLILYGADTCTDISMHNINDNNVWRGIVYALSAKIKVHSGPALAGFFYGDTVEVEHGIDISAQRVPGQRIVDRGSVVHYFTEP